MSIFVVYEISVSLHQGGFYSIVTAFKAFDADASSIDIDSRSLTLPITIALLILVVTTTRYLDFSLEERWKDVLMAGGVVLGGLILSGIVGEPVNTHLMTAHGYSRCSSGDHTVGRGKSRVYLHNYVLNLADCAPRHRVAGQPVPATNAAHPREGGDPVLS